MKQTLEAKAFDVLAGGRRLRVRTLGDVRGGPALVFLHEGLGSIAQWRDFPEALAQAAGLPALVYDRYGHGGSEAREGPQAPDFFEVEARTFLPGVLEACGVARPFLVGHSDGGTIALLYAAAFPDRPLGVVAEAAHVFVEDLSLENIAKATAAFETTPLKDRLRRHHGAKVQSMFHGWSDVWLSREHRHWRIVDRLQAVTAPVLVVQGEDDEYGTLAQVEAIAAGVGGPARTLVLPGCGHAPHLQAREAVLEGMARFIRETVSSSGLMTP